MRYFLLENTLVVLLLPTAYYVLWRLFRNTWQALDEEAHQWNAKRLQQGTPNLRPLAVFAIASAVLTWQEYYGGAFFYQENIYPLLCQWDKKYPAWVQLAKYKILYEHAWWELIFTLGYVVLPFTLWKVLFPKDSLLDFGLRTQGFFRHIRLYSLFLILIVVGVVFASFQSDFLNYYPCYHLASRSWWDFLLWEAIYLPSFFALEIFFRGWWLVALRKSLGAAAIFSMTVPYCMIHFGKPYLETMGTVMGATALGSLSMKTKSVYQGTLLHIALALSMDLMALAQRGDFPTTFWP
ncbi:MAG: CPBP family glutamic-type intramembrane protease [Bacteroidota bacterium]